MYSFEDVYQTLVGMRDEKDSVPGVEDITEEGTPFAEAYRKLWDSRISLGERFSVDFEDRDMEQIMSAILDIEAEIGRYMYRYGMEFAKKE